MDVSSLAEWCCPEEAAAAKGTTHFGAHVCLCSYRFPFLLASLKIGWINILLLASTKALELHRTVLIHKCSCSCFTSDLSLYLNRFVWTGRFSKCLFLLLLPNLWCVILWNLHLCPGTHTLCWLWGDIACCDCRTRMFSSLCASLKCLRCLSIYLCYHTSFPPRNLCDDQLAQVDWFCSSRPSLLLINGAHLGVFCAFVRSKMRVSRTDSSRLSCRLLSFSVSKKTPFCWA